MLAVEAKPQGLPRGEESGITMHGFRTLALPKLRMFVLAAMAATTLSIGGLAAAEPTFAMRHTCNEGASLFYDYMYAGDYWYARGNNYLATYYYNKAREVAANTYCP
jgi:hypothetical protein